MSNETMILRAVRQFLNLNGFYVVRMHQGMGAHKGISDLVAMKSGKTLWIEIKTQKGKLSEHQKAFAASVENAGNIYAVVRSIEDAEQLIEKHNLLVSKRLLNAQKDKALYL